MRRGRQGAVGNGCAFHYEKETIGRLPGDEVVSFFLLFIRAQPSSLPER